MKQAQHTLRALSVRRVAAGVLIGVLAIGLVLIAFARWNLTYSMEAPNVPEADSAEATEFLNLVARLANRRTEFAQELRDERWKALETELRPVVTDLDALASLPSERLVFAATRYPNEPSRLGDGMSALRNLTTEGVRRALREHDCLRAAQLMVQALRIASAVGRTGNRDDVLQFAVFSQAFSGPFAWIVDECDHEATRLFLADNLPPLVQALPPLSDAVRREWAAVARALDDSRWINRLRDDYDFFGMRPGQGELKHWTVWAFERRNQVRALEERYQYVVETADRPYVEVGPAIHDHDAPALVARLDPAPEWREHAGRRGRAATRLLLVALELQSRAGIPLQRVPLDPLTGKPLLRRTDGRWYSVGINGEDEAGKPTDLYGEEGDVIYRDYRNGKPATWTP